MALGIIWLAAGALGVFAHSEGTPSLLGPLLGIIFLALVLVVARVWFNRPDKP